jgi:hypothetical protein
MLKINVLLLFPEFAPAFASVVIGPSHVVGAPDNQRNVVPPTKPHTASFGKGSHRIEVSSIGCPDARVSNKRIQFHLFQ